MNKETEVAKKLLAQGKKQQALICLKKKKLQQSMLEKSQAQLQNLITMVCLCTTLIACCVTIFLHFVRAD